MDIGKGIAVAGIWLSVAFASMHVEGNAIVGVAIAAACATVFGLRAWVKNVKS